MHLNEAEKKLEKYRARKKREALINYYTTEVQNMFAKFVKTGQEVEAEAEATRNLIEVNEPDATSNISSDEDYYSDEPTPLTIFDYIHYCLWFILWVTVYAIFIKLQFGTVYFVLSLIIGMYLNTRTRPKRKNEVSAYSVFNRNCESIEGTLDADKLTREMVYGVFSR